MAKRFTDTEIWDKEWFMQLSCRHKCLIRYLFDKCDVAGIWQPNWVLASTYIGEKVSEKDLSAFGKHLEKLADGKIFVIDFIEFQYGELSENCTPHKKIISILKKNKLFDRVSEGYYKGRTTLKEKDKEEEVEMEKEKEKEEEKKSGDEKFLVPQMSHAFKASMPDYLPDMQRDFKPLYSIAKFLCAQAKAKGPPESHATEILDAWGHISRYIATDKFYSQKSLATISNHIQEIAQKALYGDKSVVAKVATLNRDILKDKLNKRFSQTG